MAEETQSIKINPKGCKGDAHSCSLVQTMCILTIFLQHPSEKVQKLKQTLLEELTGYEEANIPELSERNIDNIKKNTKRYG